MKKSKRDTCKTKDCKNSVISGDYCEYCKSKRKEDGAKIVGGVFSFGFLAWIANKKGYFKNIVSGVTSIIRMFR